VHVDFMIGSPEMDIDGLDEHNRPDPIMRNGEWVSLP
ncbi:MAG: aminopeptidase, partial [Opitutales bacterium]|nr:aminopeptidase [Opitutales bacterium]